MKSRLKFGVRGSAMMELIPDVPMVGVHLFSSLVALALAKTAAADGGRLTSKVPQYEREVPPTSGYVEDSAPFGHLGRVLLEQELAQHENAVLLGLGARAVRVVWNRGGRDGRSTAIAPIPYEHALGRHRLSVHLDLMPDKMNEGTKSTKSSKVKVVGRGMAFISRQAATTSLTHPNSLVGSGGLLSPLGRWIFSRRTPDARGRRGVRREDCHWKRIVVPQVLVLSR